jgi:hypothetical protein
MHEPAVRYQIEYADHNESFAAFLPRNNTVASMHWSSKEVGPWVLLALDAPFDYQFKIGEPYQYRRAIIDAFLIRSRWEGSNVGDLDGVSVSILLVEKGMRPIKHNIDVDDYVHIAWGTCRPMA